MTSAISANPSPQANCQPNSRTLSPAVWWWDGKGDSMGAHESAQQDEGPEVEV